MKGGRPILNRVVEIGQDEDEVFVTGENVSITGRDLAPSVPLEIAAVVTSSLGKKGARHEVAVEDEKETLLLCGAVSAATKGPATLEVSVVSSPCATGRFTATRRVKVC